MKLSMRIIEQWLDKYEPIVTSISPEPTISGIRLFSYDKAPDKDYVYIGRNRDFFDTSSSNEVLLVHRKDVISLNTQELEDVFDVVMDAFVYYQNWEQQMLSAYQHENPVQCIIDSCADIFGPMFFMNMSLQVTAFSKQYPPGSINQNWDDFWEHGMLSLNSMNRMEQSVYMNKMIQHWDDEIFYEPAAEKNPKYPYSMMISQENAYHELTGQLTIISEQNFQEYHRHLAVFLKRALCLVAAQEQLKSSGSIQQNLFMDYLTQNRQDLAGFQSLYRMKQWNPEQSFMVVLLRKENPPFSNYKYYQDTLQRYFSRYLFCILNNNGNSESELIAALIPLEKSSPSKKGSARYGARIPNDFFLMAGRLGLIYGCSYPLEGIENMVDQFRQAKIALQNGEPLYYHCALEDLTDCRQDKKSVFSVHPVLRQISAYDQAKGTDFYTMLKIYLRCERNRVLTAQKLFVHKNTLVYRIEKLINMFDLNLDDSYEREYLLLSYRILDKR